MLNLMSSNDLERLLQGGIPQNAVISHKNGWLENVHGDAGIVFPPNGRNYVIAVFVWEEGEFFTFERAWPLIEGVSRAAWNYFAPEEPLIEARANLPEQAQACEAFSPPYGEVNLDNISAWRGGGCRCSLTINPKTYRRGAARCAPTPIFLFRVSFLGGQTGQSPAPASRQSGTPDQDQ